MSYTQFEQPVEQKSQIAVVGAGAAGLTAAFLLAKKYQVTLFEKEPRLGGHAHSIEIKTGADAGTILDIGFMVFNDHNYLTLHDLLSELGNIEIGNSDMSFSYYSEKENIQYAYSNPSNLLKKSAQRRSNDSLKHRSPNPIILRTIKEILKFGEQALQDLEENFLKNLSLGEYLKKRNFSADLIQFYIVPTTSAIWSTPPNRVMLDFPAETFAVFMRNHGMLGRDNVPQWQYIKGGSRTYVNAISSKFQGKIETNAVIEWITRSEDKIKIKNNGQIMEFDYTVIATHADQALELLKDPSANERDLLGAWEYQRNHTIVHTDQSVMPPDLSAWAAWNYTQETDVDEEHSFSISYHLNRLQEHTKTQHQYFVTLNRHKLIPQAYILKELEFTHPIYTFNSIKTQSQLTALNGKNRTYYCGSYFGYGFHEDAVQSGVKVAEKFGIKLGGDNL